MAQRTPQKEYTDESLNKGQSHADQRFNAQALSAREQNAWEGMTGDNYNDTTADDPHDKPASNKTKVVRSQEKRGDGQWVNKVDQKSASASPARGKRLIKLMDRGIKFAKKPGGIIGIIGLGGVGTVIGIIMFLLPNKLTMAVENVMSAVGAVPEYAMQQRMEYLTTRYLASRILSLADNDPDSKLIFCKSGSIACSLTSTKFADFFDKKYKLEVKPTVSGASVKVNPQGRAGLGQKAISWNVEYSRASNLDGKIRTITKTIDSNKDMKKYIKKEIRKTYPKNFLLRKISKRILMKKYGVTHFRAFEKTRNKAAIKTADIKAKIALNTVGKILPKMPAYLGCLQGESSLACKKSLDALSVNIDKKIDKINSDIEKTTDPNQKQALEKRKQSYSELKKGVGKPDMSGPIGKLISKNVLSKVAGPAFVAGIVDIVFSLAESVDEKTLEYVSYEIMSQAYYGLGYGDEFGIVTNVDKMKVEGLDMEVLGALNTMYEDMGSSPLYQVRTGQTEYDPTKRYQAMCDTEDGRKMISLPAGELVCPEEKMVKSLTTFTEDPRWKTFTAIAKVWNSSIGLIFDAVGAVFGAVLTPVLKVLGAVLGAITDLPGLSPLKSWSVEKFSAFVSWVVDSTLGIPNIGPGAPGTSNYVGLDGAIARSVNDSMEGGVNPETGEILGAGARVLSPKEVGVIHNKKAIEEREEFNSSSVMAKIFDTELRGSAINKVALAMPTSLSSTIASFPRLIGGIGTILSTDTYAVSPAVYNPHGFPVYGFGAGDREIFEADPTTYTEDYCKKSAKAREDSLKLRKEVSDLPTYGVTDPCAFEKVVVASMLDEANITDDKNSIKEPDSEQMVIGSSSDNSGGDQGFGQSPGQLVSGAAWPVNKKFFEDRKGVFFSAHGTSSGTFTTSGRNGYALDLGANRAFKGERPPVYAMFGGTVSKLLCNTKSAIIITSNVEGKTVKIAYAHIEGRSFRVGQKITAGEKIGNVGEAGCKVFGAHLHLDMAVDNRPICPQDVLRDMGESKPLDFDRYVNQVRRGCGAR